MKRVDWAAMERLALGQLGLLPQDFWALTPREFQMMVGTGLGDRPLTAAGLSDLERSVQQRLERKEPR